MFHRGEFVVAACNVSTVSAHLGALQVPIGGGAVLTLPTLRSFLKIGVDKVPCGGLAFGDALALIANSSHPSHIAQKFSGLCGFFCRLSDFRD